MRSLLGCIGGPLTAIAVAASCTGDGPALLARVQVDQSSLSRCATLVATGEDGGQRETAPIGVSADRSLVIAVYQGPLSTEVTLQAHGYAAADCTPPADELSDRLTATFDPRTTLTYDLTLRAEGSCDDEVDGDRDGLIDCADPACAVSPGCADGGSGSDGGTAIAFPYPPSNFSPVDIDVPEDAGLVINCDAGYDTGTRTGWLCGAPLPASYVIDGGPAGPLVLLAVNGLAITDAGQWNITGPHPLAVAVYGNARLDGPLLAGASGATGGPGSSWQGCPGAGSEGRDGGSGGGGGGGGGYGRPGAGGSRSALGGGPGAPGGDGGVPFGTPELVPLRAGCAGGPGGVVLNSPLAGGGGGGAIQLSAAGAIQVASFIAAPGGGGRGAVVASNNGGGGGGSGGGILLEASRISFGAAARVTANGGAGGGGDDGFTSEHGEDGRIDGPFPARGGGGPTVTPGGDGGAGTVEATPGQEYTPGGALFGGGGGGGGVGRIRLNASERCTFQGVSPGEVFSPPATSNQAGDAGCP